MIRVEDVWIVLSEDGLQFIVDDVLDVFCTVCVSLRAGSWSIRFVVIDFFVEEDLKVGESLICFWSIPPSFAGGCEQASGKYEFIAIAGERCIWDGFITFLSKILAFSELGP